MAAGEIAGGLPRRTRIMYQVQEVLCRSARSIIVGVWKPTYAGSSRRYGLEKKMGLECAALRGV